MSGLSRVYWNAVVGEEIPAPDDCVDKGLDVEGQALLSAVLAYVRKTGNSEFSLILSDALEQLPDFIAYQVEQDDLLMRELYRRRSAHFGDIDSYATGSLICNGLDLHS